VSIRGCKGNHLSLVLPSVCSVPSVAKCIFSCPEGIPLGLSWKRIDMKKLQLSLFLVLIITIAGLINQAPTLSYAQAVRLKFTTPPRNIKQGCPSDYITVEAQDDTGNKIMIFNESVTLVSSSSNGKFSADLLNWSPSNNTDIYLVNGSGTFYYIDLTVGNPVITVSRASLASDTQTETVQFATVSNSSSFLRVNANYARVPADGKTPCTITIFVFDGGTALYNRQVTVYTSRGPSFDIINQPSLTDLNGMCTASIISSASGGDTVVAVCEGVTITENILGNPSFELGASPPTNWGYAANSGFWGVSTNTFVEGARSVVHTCPSTADNFIEYQFKPGAGWPYNALWPITGNTGFSVSQYCKTDNLSSGTARIRIIWFKDDAVIGEYNSSGITGTQPWTLEQTTFTSPVTANGLFYRGMQGGIGTAWFDCVRLSRVPTITFGAGKIKFGTSPCTTTINNPSSSITVEARDDSGNIDSTDNETVILSSSSATGFFSLDRANWVNTTTVYLVSGRAVVHFKDTAQGSPLITASRPGLSADTQMVSVVQPSVNETASYITFRPY